MIDVLALAFDQADIANHLKSLDASAFDGLDFGVIGFEASGKVCIYNSVESKLAGLPVQRVIGQPMFTVVAPCMNNYLVAQRFADAAADGSILDATVDYVLTLRMRPVKVKMRLLASPALPLNFVLINRRS